MKTRVASDAMTMNDPIYAKKSLGQHFLLDPNYLKKIIEVARITKQDQVMEIGPGLGHLTRLLADKAGRLLAIELDDRLIEKLRREFSESTHVEIVHADALEYPFERLPGAWKMVANLPYYISTPIIQKALAAREKFKKMVLMLQKEVAERIVSGPTGKRYGFLSVLVQLYTEPLIEFIVPAAAFTPRPDVDSAVVSFTVREKSVVEVEDEGLLIEVVKAGFSQRRKTLRNALRRFRRSDEKLRDIEQASGIDLSRRAETLSIEEFARLSNGISRVV